MLTEGLGLKFRHWRWLPHILSINQKAERAQQAILLLAPLNKAEKRRWANFWTGDESCILCGNPPTGSWMTIDEELPQRMRQTIGADKSMLTVFFNPHEFAIVNLLPQGRSSTAAYFAENVIVPLVDRHAQQVGDIADRNLQLHFHNSRCHTARQVQDEMVCRRCVRVPHPPYSPDLAIADFSLFGRLKHQLSGRTMASEDEVLENVTEILNALPGDEVTNAFSHWKERCQLVAHHNGEFYPN
jgi:hypothetical protein